MPRARACAGAPARRWCWAPSCPKAAPARSRSRAAIEEHSMNLSTPIEPIAPRAAAASPLALRDAREATHALLFGRIACAVASSCGSVHAANEDAHSVLDQEPLFV